MANWQTVHSQSGGEAMARAELDQVIAYEVVELPAEWQVDPGDTHGVLALWPGGTVMYLDFAGSQVAAGEHIESIVNPAP